MGNSDRLRDGEYEGLAQNHLLYNNRIKSDYLPTEATMSVGDTEVNKEHQRSTGENINTGLDKRRNKKIQGRDTKLEVVRKRIKRRLKRTENGIEESNTNKRNKEAQSGTRKDKVLGHGMLESEKAVKICLRKVRKETSITENHKERRKYKTLCKEKEE